MSTQILRINTVCILWPLGFCYQCSRFTVQIQVVGLFPLEWYLSWKPENLQLFFFFLLIISNENVKPYINLCNYVVHPVCSGMTVEYALYIQTWMKWNPCLIYRPTARVKWLQCAVACSPPSRMNYNFSSHTSTSPISLHCRTGTTLLSFGVNQYG